MTKPFDNQVGGNHYVGFAIQPAEFCEKNRLSFLEGCIIKRICRHEKAKGLQDLEKAIDEIKKLAYVVYGVNMDKNSLLEKSMDELVGESIMSKKKAPQPQGYMYEEPVKASPDKRVALEDNELSYSPPKKCKRCD